MKSRDKKTLIFFLATMMMGAAPACANSGDVPLSVAKNTDIDTDSAQNQAEIAQNSESKAEMNRRPPVPVAGVENEVTLAELAANSAADLRTNPPELTFDQNIAKTPETIGDFSAPRAGTVQKTAIAPENAENSSTNVQITQTTAQTSTISSQITQNPAQTSEIAGISDDLPAENPQTAQTSPQTIQNPATDAQIAQNSASTAQTAQTPPQNGQSSSTTAQSAQNSAPTANISQIPDEIVLESLKNIPDSETEVFATTDVGKIAKTTGLELVGNSITSGGALISDISLFDTTSTLNRASVYSLAPTDAGISLLAAGGGDDDAESKINRTSYGIATGSTTIYYSVDSSALTTKGPVLVEATSASGADYIVSFNPIAGAKPHMSSSILNGYGYYNIAYDSEDYDPIYTVAGAETVFVGVIYRDDYSLAGYFKNVVFANNSLSSSSYGVAGGAVALINSSISNTANNVFINNVATGMYAFGGAMFVKNSLYPYDISIYGSFIGNQAHGVTSCGGAIYAEDDISTTFMNRNAYITGSYFARNITTGRYASLAASGGAIAIVNGTEVGVDYSSYTGYIWSLQSNTFYQNYAIAGNYAEGGAIYCARNNTYENPFAIGSSTFRSNYAIVNKNTGLARGVHYIFLAILI